MISKLNAYKVCEKNLYAGKCFKKYRFMFPELLYSKLGKFQGSENWSIDGYRKKIKALRFFWNKDKLLKKLIILFIN